MATLVLGTIGRAFGGPLGGIIGTAVGGFVDRGILGGRGGDAARLGNLSVQSAAYGETIPVISGRMRAAGNLIWTTGITESAGGGGKRNGGSTSAYSYSASFAVGLAGREIADVGRVWADGRLIRDAAGMFLSPTTMRLHHGSELQAPDPLIAAAEGGEGTPAYRGMAYAVFEDLALADFGNRIPNLTFEIIADAEARMDAGIAIVALATNEGRAVVSVSGVFPPITGHFSGSSGTIADTITGLIEIAGGAVVSGDTIQVIAGPADSIEIPVAETQARVPGETRSRERRQRMAGDGRVNDVEIGFFDIDRDYQPGLQRARTGAGGAAARQAIASAMTAGEAKTLAQSLLGRTRTACLRTAARLPWRYLGVRAGELVTIGDDGILWRVREARFESFVVNLALERAETLPTVALSAFSGRALAFDDLPAGPSVVHVLDLPLLPGESLGGTRLWIAVAGASPGWRRAGIEISADGGASYAPIGVVEGGTVMGVALSRLMPVGEAGSDALEVELLSDRMWLEGRPEASILAGANLALIGDELVQFSAVEALAPCRFRLSGLLRGRYEMATDGADHVAGERFVLLDRDSMLVFAMADDAGAIPYRVRANGSGDGASGFVEGRVRPPSKGG